jgi:hypothetical protein
VRFFSRRSANNILIIHLDIDSPNKSIVDRPYAGYLFGEFGKSFFYKSQSVLKIDFQVGYVGPNVFGKEVQTSLHKLVGYKEVLGWEKSNSKFTCNPNSCFIF